MKAFIDGNYSHGHHLEMLRKYVQASECENNHVVVAVR